MLPTKTWRVDGGKGKQIYFAYFSLVIDLKETKGKECGSCGQKDNGFPNNDCGGGYSSWFYISNERFS